MPVAPEVVPAITPISMYPLWAIELYASTRLTDFCRIAPTLPSVIVSTASEGDKHAEAHAKNDAKEKAAAIGATHIKWIVPCCTSVEAEAYRCDVPE